MVSPCLRNDQLGLVKFVLAVGLLDSGEMCVGSSSYLYQYAVNPEYKTHQGSDYVMVT